MKRLQLAASSVGLASTLLTGHPAWSEPDTAARPATLEVTEQGPNLPWTLVVRNLGPRAMRLVADPRLLWLEIMVPGQKKMSMCRLPAELFPTTPSTSHEVLLRPDEAVTSSFDPRFYCFSSDRQRKLVPGAVVHPRFGWPEKTKAVWRKGKRVEEPVKQVPPYVLRGDSPGDASIEPVKVLEGQPWALGSDYALWTEASRLSDSADDAPWELRLSQGSDAESELETTVTLTLRNRSRESQRVYLRRELVTFEVISQGGAIQCDPYPDLRAPDPQEFVTLRPGGSTSLTSRLIELCPRGTFARPGLYLVHARLDARESGEEYGLDAFVGRVVTRWPVTLRIRRGHERTLPPTMHPLKAPPPAPSEQNAAG
jgi:hypothetical protein